MYKVTMIKKDYVKKEVTFSKYEYVVYFMQSHTMEEYESIIIRRIK